MDNWQDELTRMSNEHQQLLEWCYLLEGFIRDTNQHVMPGSKVGKKKQWLAAKRPLFLKQLNYPLG